MPGPFIATRLATQRRGGTAEGPAPSFAEGVAASFQTARDDQSGHYEGEIIDAYRPVIEQLVAAGRSPLRYVAVSRDTFPDIERRIWADIGTARARDPQAFAGVAADADAFRRDNRARIAARMRRDAETSRRAGLTSNLVGGFGGAMMDPVNVGTMSIGAAATTLRGAILGEAAVNAGTELIQLPAIERERALTGRTLTGEEKATNVVLGGVFGGVVGGAAHAIAPRAGAALRHLRDRAPSPPPLREIWDRLPERVRSRWASADDVDDAVLADIADEVIGADRLSAAERQAAQTVRRQAEIVSTSPYQPGVGTGAHVARVEDVAQRMATGAPPPTRVVPDQANAWEQVKRQFRAHESGGDDGARNPRSSATGRYQVIDGTWLSVARRFADAQGASDAYLLQMRSHPVWQERVMDALGADYRKALARAGAPETTGNLYLMHFAGTGGGTKILRAAPETPIERVLSDEAVSANPFLKGKTAGEVIDWAHQVMRSERSAGPVLRRDGFADDDAGDVAWRAAQREVEAADAELARAQDAVERTWDDDVPFDVDERRGSVANADIAEPLRPTVTAQAAAELEADGLGPAFNLAMLPRKGEPGVSIVDEEGHFVSAVFRDKDGVAQGVVRMPLTDEAREISAEVSSYVRPEARRQGIATRLYDRLRQDGYGVDDLSGTADLTPDGAAFVNARRTKQRSAAERQTASAPRVEEVPDDIRAYWANEAERGRKLEPMYAVQDADGATLTWTPSRQQAARVLREEGGDLSVVRHDPPAEMADPVPASLTAFDDPDGAAIARQIDSLEHDLRMLLDSEEGADMTVRLDDEGDVINAADALDDLDDDFAAFDRAEACMTPGGDA